MEKLTGKYCKWIMSLIYPKKEWRTSKLHLKHIKQRLFTTQKTGYTLSLSYLTHFYVLLRSRQYLSLRIQLTSCNQLLLSQEWSGLAKSINFGRMSCIKISFLLINTLEGTSRERISFFHGLGPQRHRRGSLGSFRSWNRKCVWGSAGLRYRSISADAEPKNGSSRP